MTFTDEASYFIFLVRLVTAEKLKIIYLVIFLDKKGTKLFVLDNLNETKS